MDQLKNVPTLSRLKSDESEQEKIQDFKLENKSITQSFNIPAEEFQPGFRLNNAGSPNKLLPPPAPASISITRESAEHGGASGGAAQNLYQIDAEGLLMDEHGQYIMDADGNFIMLTEQQIKSLKDSNMLIE